MRSPGLHREPETMLRPGVRPAPRRVLFALAFMLGGFGLIVASAASVLLA